MNFVLQNLRLKELVAIVQENKKRIRVDDYRRIINYGVTRFAGQLRMVELFPICNDLAKSTFVFQHNY